MVKSVCCESCILTSPFGSVRTRTERNFRACPRHRRRKRAVSWKSFCESSFLVAFGLRGLQKRRAKAASLGPKHAAKEGQSFWDRRGPPRSWQWLGLTWSLCQTTNDCLDRLWERSAAFLFSLCNLQLTLLFVPGCSPSACSFPCSAYG